MSLVSSNDMLAELRPLNLSVECSDLFSSDVLNLTGTLCTLSSYYFILQYKS